MSRDNVQQQMKLLRLRRIALRISIVLYENLKSIEEVAAVSELFEQCHYSCDEKVILEVIEQLKQFAKERHIPLPQ